MPDDRTANILRRIAETLPSAYAVRTDRLMDGENASPVVVVERESEKPLKVRLPLDRAACGRSAHYVHYRGEVSLPVAWSLIDAFRALQDHNPASAWPLRPDARSALDVHLSNPSATIATPLPAARVSALEALAQWIPASITEIRSHELRVLGSGKREVKRHFVSFHDATGECASLPWTMVAAHALYRLTDEGVEPRANRWRLECWARQINLSVDGLINLVIALNTPVTLLGLTRIWR